MNSVRIDKWLWSVRIFKSRTKATDACKSGKVVVDDRTVKASYKIEVGKTIFLHKNGFDLIFKVNELLKTRVSATLAEPCYENLTPQSELDKFKNWFVGKGASEKRERGAGRPTKKERREIDDFKFDQFLDYLEIDDEN